MLVSSLKQAEDIPHRDDVAAQQVASTAPALFCGQNQPLRDVAHVYEVVGAVNECAQLAPAEVEHQLPHLGHPEVKRANYAGRKDEHRVKTLATPARTSWVARALERP